MMPKTFELPDAKPPPKAKRKYRRCWECGRRAEHEHHVVPKVLGGKRTVPLCNTCHSKIHGRKLCSSLLIRAGQAKAKANGSPGPGRPKGSRSRRDHKCKRKVDVELAKSLRGQGVKVAEIAERFNCSKPAIYQALKEAR